MKTKLAVLAAGLGMFLAALPVLAHHSFAAEYDAQKPISVKGVVTKMDWVNPHSWIRMDVMGEDGKVEHWSCEALPPNGLFRQGWRKDSLKPGDEIVVEGYRAKDGSTTMWSRSVKLANGKRLFAGSADATPDAPRDKK